MAEAAGGIAGEKNLMPFKDALIAQEFMNSFENFLRNEFRIVSRGQIDHWFAQKTAQNTKEKNGSDEANLDDSSPAREPRSDRSEHQYQMDR